MKSNSDKNMADQKIAIEKTIDDWMNYKSVSGGAYEQTDDILLIGIRVQ